MALKNYQKVKRHVKTEDGYQLLSQWGTSDAIQYLDKDGNLVEDKTLQDRLNELGENKPLSQAEYDAGIEAGTITETDGIVYYITDGDAFIPVVFKTTAEYNAGKADGSITDTDGKLYVITDKDYEVDASVFVYKNKTVNNYLDQVENISDEWNASTTYAVGSYCIYNNKLWKCLVQNSGSAPAENANWTCVKVSTELSTLNSTLSNDVVIDVTSEFTVNQPAWFNATYNPKSRTVTINLSANFGGVGGVGNGDTKITPPSKYTPLSPNLGWLGCAGNVKTADSIFYYPIIGVSNGLFVVYYSAGVIADTLGVSFTYQIA